MPAQAQFAPASARTSPPPESITDRKAREQRALIVARDMLRNGCASNTIMRYTGLDEATLRSLSV